MSEPERISVDDLRLLVRKASEGLGLSLTDAATVTEVIVDADLHGVHSHGTRLLVTHIPQMLSGVVNVRARPRLVVDHGVTGVVDGDFAYGPVACSFALGVLCSRAKKHGLAALAIRHSSHWGCPSFYGRRAASEGLILIGASNTGKAMPLWGSGEKGVGNNPVVIAVPRQDGNPWVLDISMQQAAWGKLAVYKDAGERLPGEWGYDIDRKATDDPAAIIESGLIRPMGDHKGSGLAVMIEALTGGLSDSLHSWEIREALEAGKGQYKSQFFLALKPDAFGGSDGLERLTSSFTARVKSLRPVDGHDTVRLPGLGSVRIREQHMSLGIPLNPTLRNAISALRSQIANKGVISNRI